MARPLVLGIVFLIGVITRQSCTSSHLTPHLHAQSKSHISGCMPARCSEPGRLTTRPGGPILILRGGEDGKSAVTCPEAAGGAVKKELPGFVAHRLAVYERVVARMRAEEEARAGQKKAIQITLPDGKVMDGVEFETTPLALARSISPGLADSSVACLIDGQPWDLSRVLEASCTLELLKFDDPRGKEVFWHSSAHILGQALEVSLGSLLVVGPATDGGFFYDSCTPDHSTVKASDAPELEKQVARIAKEKQVFERLVMTKDEALEMFSYSPFKTDTIMNKVPEGSTCTAYRCGPLIDLCRGPHLPHTGMVKALAVTKNSAAHWKGNISSTPLQRVYGVSFPDKKRLKEHQAMIEEAKLRDHREIGRKQGLFFFHILSPGSCFFLPHGTIIYNRLMNMLRVEYRTRGYSEVITPNIFNLDLWRTSGHLDMSYRDLPMRIADFGALHRNEPAGALNGLTRVRRFQQDDAHIFCTPEHVSSEISDMLAFIEAIYSRFGLGYEMSLSTRPDKFVGERETWDQAEAALREALGGQTRPWTVAEGDGAFYGPKIDFSVVDALSRRHQCATIQLDFQLPQRFNLTYSAPDSVHGEFRRPVMIHRAILGSLERFIALLTEHLAGKWPLWLSPRQVAVVPISVDQHEYAKEVVDSLRRKGVEAVADYSDATLNKKIRSHQLLQTNYILVLGRGEMANSTVNVRTRDNRVLGEQSLEDFTETLLTDAAAFK
ncbi:hypothetical protein T484DRAFT_2015730 [Baffinella frigidus]|nr:hypothetical protein T484DRAFT_2015730 [Cryptophyta sp. CCMP2293]